MANALRVERLAEGYQAARASVLVVDDDRVMRMVARQALEKEQFHVLEACDGESALQQLASHGVDLVLLDACMPGMDGFTACREIRALPHRSQLPIIMVTGLDDESAVDSAFDSGASDYVSKPINWTVLKKRIGSIVSAPVPERAALGRGVQRLDLPEGLADAALRLDCEGVIRNTARIANLPAPLASLLTLDACLFDLLPGTQRSAAIDAWHQCRGGRRPSSFTLSLLESQTPFVGEIHLMPQGDDVLCLIKNHTDNYLAEQQLYQIAHHDPVTKLARESLFRSWVEQALRQDAEQGMRTLVCRILIENYHPLQKQVDYCGLQSICRHLVARLQGVGSAVAGQQNPPSQVQFGRLSDHEFALLMGGVADEQPLLAALKEIAAGLADPFVVDGQRLAVDCTLGIALTPEAGLETDTLMDSARYACAARQHLSEGAIVRYTPHQRREATLRSQMERLLRRDLELGRLHMNYQPKVAANSLQLIGIEALVRWQSEELGMVSPAEFIPLAEKCGLMLPLSEFVIDAVLDQSARWCHDRAFKIPIAINLPGSLLIRSGIVESLQQAMKTRGIDPAQLEIEVTEEVMIDRSGRAIEHLQALRAMGVRIAIDDFGTGYSSLSYLRDLPVDILKIDRSFVASLDSEQTALSIARTIIAVGHELGLEVVAEGVETAEQLQRLRELGCDVIQGYYTGRPQSAAALCA